MNFIDKTKRQFDRWAKIYDSFLFRIYFEPLYQKLIGLIEKEAGNVLSRGGKFLDVACGTGEIIYRLAKKYPESTFYGIDLSPEMK
ncbi:MAG: methyltransferase domain-containing protein [Candidatus Portnoybacteria bacterium]|nr:methyltransferase domain-containing protein [Candidatus Portnoybacteria bacterium]